MKLKESTTFVNLARAFAGECQDGARYQFLKDKAEREGLAYVGQICTEHATNEMKHAKVFLRLYYRQRHGESAQHRVHCRIPPSKRERSTRK